MGRPESPGAPRFFGRLLSFGSHYAGPFSLPRGGVAIARLRGRWGWGGNMRKPALSDFFVRLAHRIYRRRLAHQHVMCTEEPSRSCPDSGPNRGCGAPLVVVSGWTAGKSYRGPKRSTYNGWTDNS